MILNHIFKGLKFNPLIALGEIILVFLGVSLSLFVDQWKNERSERQEEHRTLIELRDGILKDEYLINSMIQNSQSTLDNIDYILTHLKNDKEWSDSLSEKMSKLGCAFEVFYPSNEGFETLKSKGISFIKNDSIRKLLTDLIFVRERTQDIGKILQKFNEDQLQKILMREFKDFDCWLYSIPNNYERLKNNGEFLNTMKLLRTYQSFHKTSLGWTNDRIKIVSSSISTYLIQNKK